jgi:hypothetical protein
MPNTICAAKHAEWEENSLADYGDFSDMVEFVNQGEDAFSGYGEWYYIPDEVLPPMQGVDYEGKTPNERAIYFGTYGNDNSPGASHYTYAEIFDMDDEEDAAEFEARKAEWEAKPEYIETDEESEDDDTDEEDGDEESDDE